jgi:ATP-dependent DNA ligase
VPRRPAKAYLAEPPAFIPPQLAKLVEHAPAGDEWLHEIKIDGYRTEARIAGGPGAILTRKTLARGIRAATLARPTNCDCTRLFRRAD